MATLLGIAGSLVLVRKLDPEDYAYYQGLTKRAFYVGWLPFAATALVVYRRLAVRDPSAAGAFRFQTLLALTSLALTGLVWSALSGASPLLALVSIAVLVLYGAWTSLRFLADAWRPVRVGVAVLLTRFLLSILIVVMVYLLAMGLWGALTASISAMAVGSLYFLMIISQNSPHGKASSHVKRTVEGISKGFQAYVKHLKEYLTANLLNAVNSTLLGLDVFAAVSLRGLSFTAPLLAFQSLLSILQETLGWALQVFHRNLLTRESSLDDARRTTHLMILASTPLFLFAAYHPTHVAMLLNPAYADHSRLLTIVSLGSLATLIQATTVNTLLGTIPVGSEHEKHRLAHILKLITTTRITYLALLTLALLSNWADKTTLEAWGLLHLAQATTITLGALLLTNPENRGAYTTTLAKSLAKATAISLALLYLTTPLLPQPHPRFWQALASLFPPAAIYLATYTLILLLADKEARSTLAKLPTLIKKPR